MTVWVSTRRDRRVWTWILHLALPSVVPWLVFEAMLLLVPVWAPDQSWSMRGVLLTAPAYAAFVGSPGAIFGAITTNRWFLLAGTTALTCTAVWAANEMVTSGDGQAGLAVFAMWYVGIPLIALAALTEWIPYRHAALAATVLVGAWVLVALGAGAVQITEPARRAADAEASAQAAVQRIRRVVATDVFAVPAGGTVTVSSRCGRGGAPGADFDLAVPTAAPHVGDALTARLRAAGWEVRNRGDFHDYFKRFDGWTARLSELNRASDGRSLTAHLDVHAATSVDCTEFRNELRNLVA